MAAECVVTMVRMSDAAAREHGALACIDDEGRVAFSRDSGKTWSDGPAVPDARSVVVTP
jgi:hypothetical protein